MERVSDDWLERQLCVGAHVIGNVTLLEIDMKMYKDMVAELQEHRKAEAGTPPSENAKEAVLPVPVKQVDGVDLKTCTVKQWFAKINEELDEMKEVVLRWGYMNSCVNSDFLGWNDNIDLADEAADTITAITSMLEAMGIDERQRQEAQRRVNKRNRERNRL